MKTIRSCLLVLSTLLWIGAERAVANEVPTCGEPSYNKRKDRAVFLWRKCFSDQWYLEAAGGRQPVAVNASLVADTSDIAIGKKADGIELNKDFIINVPRKKKDGFNFLIKSDGSGCLTVKSPEDIPLYVGKNRVEFSKSISVPGLKPCDGPLLEYRFDSSSTLYKDSGMNGWDGSTAGRGRIYYTSLGYSRYGASLDGRDDHMIIPESKDLNMKKYTFMAWVRYSDNSRADDNNYALIQKTGALWFGIHKQYHTLRAGGKFGGCTKNDNFQLKGINPIPTETWTHVAVTNDQNTMKVYINGELDVEGDITSPGDYCKNEAPFNVGSELGETRASDRHFLRGYMDTVRIYDKDLPQDEIRAEMHRH